jgi:hypothetical protein
MKNHSQETRSADSDEVTGRLLEASSAQKVVLERIESREFNETKKGVRGEHPVITIFP